MTAATETEIVVPAGPLALARGYAARAAYLAVSAEQVQDTYPGSAAHLEYHASCNRALAHREVSTALERTYPGLSVGEWWYHSRRITGDLMRDAYATERAKTAQQAGGAL